jgi:hypothetical protein
LARKVEEAGRNGTITSGTIDQALGREPRERVIKSVTKKNKLKSLFCAAQRANFCRRVYPRRRRPDVCCPAMSRRFSKLLSPPGPTESHDAFMSRCQADGGGKQECENLWTDAQGIAPPKGIPLRADPAAMREGQRRSFIRACAATFLADRDREDPAAIMRRNWAGDRDAERLLRAATSPTTTAGFPAAVAVRVLELLAPNSAGAAVLAAGTTFDLTGLTQILIPNIAPGSVPPPAFIAEGVPFPIINMSVNPIMLGPVSKLLIGAGFTFELNAVSGGIAEQLIGHALSIATTRSLDAALFGSAAATASSPAGLLHGLTPLAASTAKGTTGLAEDMGALAEAIGVAADADEMVLVMPAKLAAQARILASIKFNNPIYSSAAIPAGTVIAIAPGGLATAYSGVPTIDVSGTAAVHFADAPIDIGTPGAPATVAAPARSAFQDAMTLLRVRANCAWVALPNTIAFMTGAAW